MDIVSRMVKEWSKEPCILDQSRVEWLFNPRDGLKLRTDGYKWLKMNQTGVSDQILTVKPENKYTVSEDFGMGKVDNIWIVNSSSNKLPGSLKERAKERIKQRGIPDFKSFDDYMQIRTSCWIVEERDGNFHCDCPKGMKGKQCWHEVGLLYKAGRLEVTSEVRSVPITQKRKRGRPKKLPHCLANSPTRDSNSDSPMKASDALENDHNGENLIQPSEDSHSESLVVNDDRNGEGELPTKQQKLNNKRRRRNNSDESENESENPIQVLVSQKRNVDAGLTNSKPPKKKARNEIAKPKNIVKPDVIKCKKRKGTCNHEIVFNQHYNKMAWEKYADEVRKAKPAYQIENDE